MGKQVWGTFSVKDHCDLRAFVAEVMLYDRLVIPVPPNATERARWEDLGWDPARLEKASRSWVAEPLPLAGTSYAKQVGKIGSLAEFVGKRAVEKAAPWKSPKAGLSPSAWKSGKSGGIPTFPTAPATTR